MTKFAKIVLADIANGTGWRTSIFFTGCSLHCPGCFNQSIWNPDVGREFTDETIEEIINYSRTDWNSGLSILGGEPTDPCSIEAATRLSKKFREAFPEKDIWMWSGRTREEIERLQNGPELLSSIDILVEGRFIQSLKDMSLVFRGSSNQRILKRRSLEWIDITNQFNT